MQQHKSLPPKSFLFNFPHSLFFVPPNLRRTGILLPPSPCPWIRAIPLFSHVFHQHPTLLLSSTSPRILPTTPILPSRTTPVMAISPRSFVSIRHLPRLTSRTPSSTILILILMINVKSTLLLAFPPYPQILHPSGRPQLNLPLHRLFQVHPRNFQR